MGMRMAVKYVLLCLSLWSLGACKVTEHYSTADMDLPKDFRLPDSVSQNLDSTLIPWRQFFEDTVLMQLIQRAFANNFDLRTANKEIAINDAYYKQSKAAFLPSLNLGLLSIERDWRSHHSRTGVEDEWYAHKGKNPPKDGYVSLSIFSNRAALDWELDLWGKLRNQKRAASALYQQSHVARRAIQTELIATLAEDYYTLLMLDEQLQVAEKNHRFRDSTLKMIQLQYTAGEVTALAVQQSQTQVLEAASLISDLKKERAIQQNNLQLLTGQLPGDIKLKATLTVQDSTYAEVRKLPLYLVQNRPDVLMARYGLTAANASVGVAQAQRYPSLTISLEGGMDALLPQNWFNIPGSLLGGFVGGFTAPVFNGRKLKTDYEVARLQRDEAEIDFQRSVYEAVVDIKNTLIALNRLEDQLKIATVKQQVAEKAVENSRMLFRAGFATYLEVITAQGEALDSELDLVQAKANLLIERIQLYRALGGGWQ